MQHARVAARCLRRWRYSVGYGGYNVVLLFCCSLNVVCVALFMPWLLLPKGQQWFLHCFVT